MLIDHNSFAERELLLTLVENGVEELEWWVTEKLFSSAERVSSFFVHIMSSY
jgi:precorrin-6B methylase 1